MTIMRQLPINKNSPGRAQGSNWEPTAKPWSRKWRVSTQKGSAEKSAQWKCLEMAGNNISHVVASSRSPAASCVEDPEAFAAGSLWGPHSTWGHPMTSTAEGSALFVSTGPGHLLCRRHCILAAFAPGVANSHGRRSLTREGLLLGCPQKELLLCWPKARTTAPSHPTHAQGPRPAAAPRRAALQTPAPRVPVLKVLALRPFCTHPHSKPSATAAPCTPQAPGATALWWSQHPGPQGSCRPMQACAPDPGPVAARCEPVSHLGAALGQLVPWTPELLSLLTLGLQNLVSWLFHRGMQIQYQCHHHHHKGAHRLVLAPGGNSLTTSLMGEKEIRWSPTTLSTAADTLRLGHWGSLKPSPTLTSADKAKQGCCWAFTGAGTSTPPATPTPTSQHPYLHPQEKPFSLKTCP